MKKLLLIWIMTLFGGCNSEQAIADETSSNINSLPLLTKYIIGKPNMAYFNAEKVVALRWGINLKHIFAGSRNRSEIERVRSEIESSNLEANNFYDKKFGDGWQARFKEEVLVQKSKSLK